MVEILLVVHLLLALSLICVVLLQRSEGGGLGIGGGGSGGMGNFMTGRGTKNLLTRTTAILAACFMLTSLALTWIESRNTGGGSLLDNLPVSAPATPEPAPSQPSTPSVPVE